MAKARDTATAAPAGRSATARSATSPRQAAQQTAAALYRLQAARLSAYRCGDHWHVGHNRRPTTGGDSSMPPRTARWRLVAERFWRAVDRLYDLWIWGAGQ